MSCPKAFSQMFERKIFFFLVSECYPLHLLHYVLATYSNASTKAWGASHIHENLSSIHKTVRHKYKSEWLQRGQPEIYSHLIHNIFITDSMCTWYCKHSLKMIAFTTINCLIIANTCEISKITYIGQHLFDIHNQKDLSIDFSSITIQCL